MLLTILATNWHLIPILSTPHNIRLGEALSLTCQRNVCAFSHNHIIASHRFHDNRRNWKPKIFFMLRAAVSEKRNNVWHFTNNLEVTFPGSHGIGVHLTHVPSPVWFLDFAYVQIPASVVVVSQNDPRILCDDVVMDAENRLSVYAHPRYLQERRTNLQH